MAQLIVESGATKSSWIILNDDGTWKSYKLDGINITSNPEGIRHVKEFAITKPNGFKRILFYGAGVSNTWAINTLKSEFNKFYPHSKVHIHHDILAAARSISDGQESIVSILGTGTNTVLFDGKKIIESVTALGYLFGDFGSGFHIGKLIINAYYYNKMSHQDAQAFEDYFLIKKPEFKETIYKAEKPNFEIAQFSKFLNICSRDLKKIILEKAFHSFFKNQIASIKDSKNYKLNFVGSISEVYQKDLRAIGSSLGYEIDKTIGDPIEGLINYHLNNND